MAIIESDVLFIILYAFNILYLFSYLEVLAVYFLMEKFYFQKRFEAENLKIYQVIKRING